jgi:hypothetical protein
MSDDEQNKPLTDWDDDVKETRDWESIHANDKFEEWIYFENGKQITVRRPNPRYQNKKA